MGNEERIDSVDTAANRGRMLIVAAAVLWSTSGFFAQAPWFDGWPAESRGLQLAFFRSGFAVVAFVPLIRRIAWHAAMLPMAVAFAGMVWTFMSAMVHGPAANAIWLQYLCPVWVMLGGRMILKEQPTAGDWRMFAFCLAGVGVILTMELAGGGNLYATALGILSGVMMATVLLCMRSLRDFDSAWLITLNHVATVVLLLPWVWVSHHWIAPSAYLALAFFGIFQMSVPYVLFARGLRTTSSLEASLLTLIEPILVPVWVFAAWQHHPSYLEPPWWTWVGGALILTGLTQRYLIKLRLPRDFGKL